MGRKVTGRVLFRAHCVKGSWERTCNIIHGIREEMIVPSKTRGAAHGMLRAASYQRKTERRRHSKDAPMRYSTVYCEVLCTDTHSRREWRAIRLLGIVVHIRLVAKRLLDDAKD